jgi:hypothetical protein
MALAMPQIVASARMPIRNPITSPVKKAIASSF